MRPASRVARARHGRRRDHRFARDDRRTAHYPETGYGYIERGETLTASGDGTHCRRPFPRETGSGRASELIAGGNVLWNAGIFAWRGSAFLAELRRWAPEVIEPLERALERGNHSRAGAGVRRLPSISIDTGVLERAEHVAVVRATFPWSDVGSWAAVADLRGDGGPNAVRARRWSSTAPGAWSMPARASLALVGVQDLIVVDTPDALLVCKKGRAQDVRLLVDELRRRRLRRYIDGRSPRRTSRARPAGASWCADRRRAVDDARPPRADRANPGGGGPSLRAHADRVRRADPPARDSGHHRLRDAVPIGHRLPAGECRPPP